MNIYTLHTCTGVNFTLVPYQPGQPIRISWKEGFSSSWGESKVPSSWGASRVPSSWGESKVPSSLGGSKVPSSWEEIMFPSTTSKPVRVFYGTTPTKASAVVSFTFLAHNHPNFFAAGRPGISESIGSKHTTDPHNTKTIHSHNN